MKFYSMKGGIEMFFVDTTTIIYKFINSVGNNNDSGYIIGEHETICEYIDEMIKEGIYSPIN